MSEHSYDDAPLWTVLSALATMPESECRLLDLGRAIKTASGWPGAYRAIGRLTAAGYAVLIDGADFDGVPHLAPRARIKITSVGLARFRAGAGYVKISTVDRVNGSGGFGVVHRSKWIPRPRQTR